MRGELKLPAMKLINGDSFFSKYIYKKGKVYISAVSLNSDWSNLVKHAIFVPLMYKIAINSQPFTDLFYTVGRNNSINVTTNELGGKSKSSGESIFKIKDDDSSPNSKGFDIIPESRIIDLQPTIFVHDQIKDAGNYSLYSGDEYVSGLSFNYDRTESDLKQFSPDELVTEYEKNGLSTFSLVDTNNKNISKVLADIGQGKKLWKWCIVLVLIFMAFETLLLRFWK